MRWKPIIEHSMNGVKELAQEHSKPVWGHFTATNPAKTTVSQKVPQRKQGLPRKMPNNPLTNIYNRLQRSGLQAELYTYRKQTTKEKPNIEDVHGIRKKEIHLQSKNNIGSRDTNS